MDDPTGRLHTSDEPERRVPPKDSRECRASGTMLVVDDDPCVRDPIAALLERAGYNILTATGCTDAIDVFRSNSDSIVAVLLDQYLADGKADDVFEELRRLRPNIPLIVMSGYMTDEVVGHFKGLGVVGFLQKPFERATLLKQVRRAIGSSGA